MVSKNKPRSKVARKGIEEHVLEERQNIRETVNEVSVYCWHASSTDFLEVSWRRSS